MTPALVILSPISPPGISLLPPLGAKFVLLAELVMALTALVIFLTAPRLRAGLGAPPIFRAALVYIGTMLLASLLGLDPVTGLGLTLLEALIVVWSYAIWTYFGEAWVRIGIVATMLSAGVLSSLLAIGMVVAHRPSALYAYVLGRATGTFVVPGELAGYLLFLLATAVGVLSATRLPVLRSLAVAALACGGAALVLTYSRAGWLGFAAGAAFLVAMRLRSPKARFAVISALLAFVVFLPFFQGHHNQTDNFTRLPIWQAALRSVELFPLTGVGPGAFRLVYPVLRPPDGLAVAFHAHNALLTTAAETGLIGLAAFVGLWWVFGRDLHTRLAIAKPRSRNLALCLAAGFVATGAQGMLDSVTVVEIGCWIPFMALTLGAAEHGLEEPCDAR
jgi:O-antigen ligase